MTALMAALVFALALFGQPWALAWGGAEVSAFLPVLAGAGAIRTFWTLWSDGSPLVAFWYVGALVLMLGALYEYTPAIMESAARLSADVAKLQTITLYLVIPGMCAGSPVVHHLWEQADRAWMIRIPWHRRQR